MKSCVFTIEITSEFTFKSLREGERNICLPSVFLRFHEVKFHRLLSLGHLENHLESQRQPKGTI